MKHLKNLAILTLIGMTVALLPITSAAASPRSWSCYRYGSRERAFARRTNEARRRRGLPKLRLDPQLSKTARRHNYSMARKNRLFHTSNSQFYNRVTRWSMLGENVGEGGNVPSLQSAFMHSPEHRANILDRNYRYVGIGVTFRHDRMWVTVEFVGGGDPGTTLPTPSC